MKKTYVALKRKKKFIDEIVHEIILSKSKANIQINHKIHDIITILIFNDLNINNY